MFDEPSSYLDVKQRLRAAMAIRNLLAANKYIIVVEHDLSVLDYMSDFICCLYGVPGAYGVVTMPFSVREGTLAINSPHCFVVVFLTDDCFYTLLLEFCLTGQFLLWWLCGFRPQLCVNR